MRILVAILSVIIFGAGCASTERKQIEEAEAYSGGYGRDDIRKTIRENLGGLRKCYEAELKNSPDLSGKLIVQWDIDDGGKASAGVIKKSLSPAVDECIKNILLGAKWTPAPKGQVGRVSYPFEFSSK